MALFQTHSNRGRTAALLAGCGIGAALMYMLDPGRGARRRALARDKALKYARVAGERFGKKSRDLKNRARGVAAQVSEMSEMREPDRPERHETAPEEAGNA